MSVRIFYIFLGYKPKENPCIQQKIDRSLLKREYFKHRLRLQKFRESDSVLVLLNFKRPMMKLKVLSSYLFGDTYRNGDLKYVFLKLYNIMCQQHLDNYSYRIFEKKFKLFLTRCFSDQGAFGPFFFYLIQSYLYIHKTVLSQGTNILKYTSEKQ